ncbi:MAG TPA: antitoxin family protein [Blastocatellia bacterium]|nr:antitoxin family protein [Blastocatellia bacterium]
MRQTIDAVFENGSFKPVNNPALPFVQGQRVKLIVEAPAEAQEDLIDLATQVFDGLSDKEIDEIERIALDRRDFFPDRHAL